MTQNNATNNSTYNSQVPAAARRPEPVATPSSPATSTAPIGNGPDFSTKPPVTQSGPTSGPVPLSDTFLGIYGGDSAPAYMPRPYSDVYVDTSSYGGVMNASNPYGPTWNVVRPMSEDDTTGSWGNLAPGTDNLEYGSQSWVTAVAKALDYRGTGPGLWAKAVAASQTAYENGQYISPLAFIQQWASGLDTSGSTRSSGGGGYGGGGGVGPQAPDSSSVRRAMDQVSMGLLGRTLSEKEFNKYYQSYVSEFSGNPDMDPQQNMIERVRQEKDYDEYQVAAKFSSALSGVLRGAI